jgi:diadenylate cyclase
MLWNYLTLLKEIHWNDLLDIGFATALFWFALHTLRTTRTRKIGIGLLLFGAVFLAADQLELKLTVWILQGITAVIVLIVIVIYQNEIRRALERFPASLLKRGRSSHADPASLTDLLLKAVEMLATANRGALIVLPGRDYLNGIITAGTPLDGQLSKALLLSIFDPNSPGHDGALVIRGDRVERFGSRLPLSDRDDLLKGKGTRHAAALGLAEKSDALVLIVSEETGRVSLAIEGRIRLFPDLETLREELYNFQRKHTELAETNGHFRRWSLWLSLEGIVALIASAVLWLVLVPGSVVENVTYDVAVEVQNIPQDYVLDAVTPPSVAVTLTGEKRNLFQVKPGALIIRLDGTLTSLGRQTFPINGTHLLLPPKVEISNLTPEQVRVEVHRLR